MKKHEVLYTEFCYQGLISFMVKTDQCSKRCTLTQIAAVAKNMGSFEIYPQEQVHFFTKKTGHRIITVSGG